MSRPVDAIIKKLKSRCPLKTPVRVIYRPITNNAACGYCTAYYTPDRRIVRFVIEIDSNLSRQALLDTMLHEWAHAMDMEQNGICKVAHRQSWGIAYSKVWKAYTKTN